MSSPREFPSGAQLDRLVLWLLGEMHRQSPEVEAWTPTVMFYALREYGLEEWHDDRHYAALVERSLDRLEKAEFVERDDVSAWRLRRMEGL